MKQEMPRAAGIRTSGAADYCFLASIPGGMRTLRQALHRWEEHGGKPHAIDRTLALLRPRPVPKPFAKSA